MRTYVSNYLYFISITFAILFNHSAIAGTVQSAGEDHIAIFIWVANESGGREANEKAKAHCSNYNKIAKFKSLEKNVYTYDCVVLQDNARNEKIQDLEIEARILELKAKALRLIGEHANNTCNRISDTGDNITVDISGNMSAELKGVIKNLVDLKSGGKGMYRKETSSGIVKEELRVTAFKDSNECRLEVLKELKSMMPD